MFEWCPMLRAAVPLNKSKWEKKYKKFILNAIRLINLKRYKIPIFQKKPYQSLNGLHWVV